MFRTLTTTTATPVSAMGLARPGIGGPRIR